MRDFLSGLQEMLKGSVGGYGNVGTFTFCSLGSLGNTSHSMCDSLSAKAAGGQ